ncbi:MAG: hypothetical protein JWQ27_1342 [Ferruginibacter sp.]|nr:hypothetical protein [Ferruginibacter sp.]
MPRCGQFMAQLLFMLWPKTTRMITIILLILISLTILFMGFFEIRLPFLSVEQEERHFKTNIPRAPMKQPGIIITKNTENNRAHIRFIKNHIRQYHISQNRQELDRL